MNIIVAGATGLIGRSLVPVLLKRGHAVTVIGRNIDKIRAAFSDAVNAVAWGKIDSLSPDAFDVVINLAGENIADSRWSDQAKSLIKNSRIEATSRIVSWCLNSKNKKIHLYNASAIGIYGLQEAINGLPRAITESDPVPSENPDCFLREVGEAWEKAAVPAVEAGILVTWMRFGVVLKKNEGILGKLALPFSLGLGSILGTGRQAFSWIHIDDLIQAILFLISNPEMTGPINIVSPRTVSQMEFAKTLATVLKRPIFLKMPRSLIKLLFGQMGEELLLGGQNIYPERLLKSGFQFKYPDIFTSLADIQ